MKELPHQEETELLYELIQDTHQLTSVVMIGASALIPVPFLDDVVKAYLEKRLFSDVAKREGLSLSKEERDRLTHEQSGGCCAGGCLKSAFLYPFKKLFRKIFYFLEIKRAIDQSTTALAQAWLFRLTLYRDLWKPGGDLESCDRVRNAIKSACLSHGVKPLEVAVSHAFAETKSTLWQFAGRFSRDTVTSDADMSKAVDKIEREEQEQLKGVTQKLSDSLNEVSEAYLVKFGITFEEHLAAELAKPKDLDLPTA